MARNNLDRILLDLDDKPLMVDGGPITLRKLSILALLDPMAVLAVTGNDDAVGKEREERYLLARRIKSEPDPVELQSNEITMIKELTGKAHGPILSGQARLMLEDVGPAEKKGAAKAGEGD